MHEAGFSFSKTIYQEDGSSSLVTIRLPEGSSVSDFYNLVTTTLGRFAEGGSTTQHPEARGKDEKVERLSGWVLGQRSGNQPCIWVYGPEHLEFKLDTVWREHFAATPFFDEIENARQWPTTSAPKRNEAVSSGFLNEIECEVVMGPHPGGKLKKDGKPLLVIKRWVGHDSTFTKRKEPEPVADTRPAIRTKVLTFAEGLETSDELLELDPGDIKAVDIIAFIESWISVCHNPGESEAVVSYINNITDERYIRANTGFALLSKANGEVVS